VKYFTFILLIIFSISGYSETSKSIDSVKLVDLLSIYAKYTKTKLLVDFKVKSIVNLHGQSVNSLTYENLLTILHLLGFTAYKDDGYLIVLPSKDARVRSLEIIDTKKKYPANQYVTDIIAIKKACAINLASVIKPLLPAHSVVEPSVDSNSIVITGTYSNIMRVRKVINVIESQTDKDIDCRANNPQA
jgi:general secretion pathway protein D